MLKKVILLAYVLILIFQVQFVFFPFGVHIFFGVIGMVLVYSGLFLNDLKYLVLKKSTDPFIVLKFFVPCFLFALLTMLINGTTDAHFVIYGINIFFSYYAFFLLAYLFINVYGSITPKLIIEYLIIAQVIYIVISLFIYFFPEFGDWIFRYLREDEDALAKMERLSIHRLHGIGIRYFTSGAVGGLVLILVAFYFHYYKLKVFQSVMMTISFVFIFVFGLMMARTIMIGGGFAIGVFILHMLNNRKSAKGVIGSVIALISTFIIYSTLLSSFLSSNMMENLTNFGFEAFYNYESTGSFDVGSNENMFSQYKTIPSNLKTWIIGDALWKGSNGGYYMKTDIGVIRYIFYFGVVGLLAFYYFQYNFLIQVFAKRSFKSFYIVSVVMSYMLVLNFKGVIDFYNVVLIFFFAMQASPSGVLKRLK